MKLRAFLNNTYGTVMMEFALAGPLLFVLTLGTFEVGRLYYTRSNLQHAVYEAARYAMVNITASNSAIADQVTQNVTAVDSAQVTVTVQNQTINSKPYKQIAAAYNFSTIAGGLINLKNVPLNVQSIIPVMP